MSMLQIKVNTVKDCVLRRGNDSISIKLSQDFFHEVTYYFASEWIEPYEETRSCNIKEAQQRYEKALKDGYKVIF